jgi:hypothetical protein
VLALTPQFYTQNLSGKGMIRTFAHSAFACGSMVLYHFCVSFFARAGRKMTHKELKITSKRKSYMNYGNHAAAIPKKLGRRVVLQ